MRPLPRNSLGSLGIRMRPHVCDRSVRELFAVMDHDHQLGSDTDALHVRIVAGSRRRYSALVRGLRGRLMAGATVFVLAGCGGRSDPASAPAGLFPPNFT